MLQIAPALVGAVGGDDHRRQFSGAAFPQAADHLAAEPAVVQVVIHQQQLRRALALRRQGAVEVAGGEHLAAPLAEQRRHAGENPRFVVHHQQAPAR
ncbi:hypothetical protein D3C78_1531340 [compost metagenome]